MQMVSVAQEMEPCCEEHKDPSLQPEFREPASALADMDRPTEPPCGPAGESEELCGGNKTTEAESCTGDSKSTEEKSPSDPDQGGGHKEERKLKKTNSWKMVRFQDPSMEDDVLERDSSAESLFPEYAMEEWTLSTFEELFMKEDWHNITDDQLLRKKLLGPGDQNAPCPTWGQEVLVKMQSVLEDRTVVEKDCKLVFVIGEGDVTQALEECVMSMRRGELTLLLADSQYAYGHLGSTDYKPHPDLTLQEQASKYQQLSHVPDKINIEPDIPAWAPLLYQLQLLDVRDKPDLLTLPIADRIRIGNQKRERGNFYFQRNEYSMAARAYCMALDVLTTRNRDGTSSSVETEEEEVRDYRVKCLNNLATAQLKLEQFDKALHTSRDVLALEPNNVKALFRTGKLLSDTSQYKEAMELLKKALKLEPATKAIHLELSKLVKRQLGGKDTREWKAKPAEILGDNITPFMIPSKKRPTGISWKFILGALVVALGSLVTSLVLTARN